MTTYCSSTMTSSLKGVSTIVKSVLENSKRLNNYVSFQICYKDNFINITGKKLLRNNKNLNNSLYFFFNLLIKEEIMNRYKTFSMWISNFNDTIMLRNILVLWYWYC